MDQRTRAEGGTFEAPTLRIILFGAGLNVNSRFTDLSEREGYEYPRMQKFNTNGIEDQWEQAPPKEGGESVGQSKSV